MSYTKQTSRVSSFFLNTSFNGGTGTAKSVEVGAVLEDIILNDGDAADFAATGRKNVGFNMLDPALTGVNITAAGKTVSYPQLAALIRQAVLDRANA